MVDTSPRNPLSLLLFWVIDLFLQRFRPSFCGSATFLKIIAFFPFLRFPSPFRFPFFYRSFSCFLAISSLQWRGRFSPSLFDSVLPYFFFPTLPLPQLRLLLFGAAPDEFSRFFWSPPPRSRFFLPFNFFPFFPSVLNTPFKG